VLHLMLPFGAGRIGVVMAVVGWRLAGPERATIARDTEAKLLFAGKGFADDAFTLRARLSQVQRAFSAGDAWAWITASVPGGVEPKGPDEARSCSCAPRAPPACPRG